MGNEIRVPSICPLCGSLTCMEWDFRDPTQSRLHCRAQHANLDMCDFFMALDIEPGHDRYIVVADTGDRTIVESRKSD